MFRRWYCVGNGNGSSLATPQEKRLIYIIETDEMAFSCLVIIRGWNKTMKRVMFVYMIDAVQPTYGVRWSSLWPMTLERSRRRH